MSDDNVSSATGQRIKDTGSAAGVTTVSVDIADLRAAFEAHTNGSDIFTRRMAINIGDFFGIKPMSLVWQLEKARIIKRGSYEWFKSNGGITADHVAEARAGRRA